MVKLELSVQLNDGIALSAIFKQTFTNGGRIGLFRTFLGTQYFWQLRCFMSTVPLC